MLYYKFILYITRGAPKKAVKKEMRLRDKRTATENVKTPPPRTSQGLEAARCRIDLLIGYKISIPFKMLTRLCLAVRHAEQDGCLVYYHVT